MSVLFWLCPGEFVFWSNGKANNLILVILSVKLKIFRQCGTFGIMITAIRLLKRNAWDAVIGKFVVNFSEMTDVPNTYFQFSLALNPLPINYQFRLVSSKLLFIKWTTQVSSTTDECQWLYVWAFKTRPAPLTFESDVAEALQTSHSVRSADTVHYSGKQSPEEFLLDQQYEYDWQAM